MNVSYLASAVNAWPLVLWPGWFAVLWVVVAGQAGGRGIRSDLGVCDGSASQGPQTD